MKSERIQNLENLFKEWGIDHFSPEELIRLNNRTWDGPDLYPPHIEIQTHIEDTVKLADKIRKGWGDAVICLSGYRPPLYNDHIDGAESSMHMHFRALDIQPVSVGDYQDFRELVGEIVQEERDTGKIVGLGIYPKSKFCHIDTGYYNYNRNW